MENEILETVLKEIMGDMKQSYNLSKENNLLATENKNLMIGIEKTLASKDAMKPIIDTEPIEQIVLKGIDKIATIIDQSKNKRRPSIQFLFFPEHNTKEYYKIVYSRILFWVVMFFVAKYLYLLGSEWISKSYDDQRYKKAWENLYKQQGKSNQKIMQKVFDSN